MRISNDNKRNICAVLLTVLIVYSFASILIVDNVALNTKSSSTDIMMQQNIFEVVFKHIKTTSMCMVSSFNVSSRFFANSFARKDMVLPLIFAFVFANLLCHRCPQVFPECHHAITVSYIQRSDGKK